MQEFLTFQRMITPMIIQVLFLVLAGLAVLGGLIMMIVGFAGGGLGWVFGGLIYLVLGPILVRVYCELLILFFRMNETLTEIKNNTAPRV